METPIFEQLAAEHGFDPLEGIEWEDIRALGRGVVARARVSPNVYDLPRYRAVPEPDGHYWQVEQAHYIGQSMVVYKPFHAFGTEADATTYADLLNEAE